MKKLAMTAFIVTFAIVGILMIKLSMNTAQLRQQVISMQTNMDSIKAEYAQLVMPCLPDTVFNKFVQIPEFVKAAWLDYSVIEKYAADQYQERTYKDEYRRDKELEKAQEKYEKARAEADATYSEIEKESVLSYLKSDSYYANRKIIDLYQTRENVGVYVWLKSNDTYWAATLSFDIGNSRGIDSPCPESFKVMLAECREADARLAETVQKAHSALETEKADIKQRHKAKVASNMAIYEKTRSQAYEAFLTATKQ